MCVLVCAIGCEREREKVIRNVANQLSESL